MALSAKDQRFLDALQAHGGNRAKTAQALGVRERNVYRILKRLRDAGQVNADGALPYTPGAGREITHVTTRLGKSGEAVGHSIRERVAVHGEDFVEPSGRIVGTTTTLANGKVERQWVRHAPEDARAEVDLRIAETLAKLTPRAPVEERESLFRKGATNRANLYVLSDAHIGMLAWAPETGADWDLKIAQRTLESAFDHLMLTAPRAERAVVCLLGDWMHYDGLLAVTPTSHHILDADGRHGKMVDVAIEVTAHVVERALQEHKTVDFLVAEGNHDLVGSVWLRKMFRRLYENEPRLTVIDEPRPYYALEFGEVFLGFHHGHLKGVKTPADLINVFAHEYPEMWGRTRRRYIHTGHRHFELRDGSKGTLIVQHPTLAARDAYSARFGYQGDRAALCTVYHRDYGEAGTIPVTPEMLA